MKYFQCKLQQGKEIMYGWIEERAAICGASIEVKPRDGLWLVVNVSHPGVDASWLIEKRKRDRDSLPSLRKEKVK